MPRIVKREHESKAPEEVRGKGEAESRKEATGRRVLRSRYLAVKNSIVDEREDISRVDSDKFKSIITEVNTLHQQVEKPREQVSDAEALLDITSTLVASVKSQTNEGLTPPDFITAMLRSFGRQDIESGEDARNHIYWGNVGLAVSHVFKKGPGCCTMLGPMNTDLKQRKSVVQRKHTRPTQSARPEELQDSEAEERGDTDKNMSAMFDALRKNRRARLENLVLNRVSFAHTVENIFALSFLVKDGRADITVDDNGNHLISPRNAPAASAVASGDVIFNHFVFRFDFKDWKLMMNAVGVGEELMPHRVGPSTCGSSQIELMPGYSQSAPLTPPIRKLSRNRGLVIQEQSVIDESPENDVSGAKVSPSRNSRKRLFLW